MLEILHMSSAEIFQPKAPSRLPRIWWGLLLLASTDVPRWMPHRISRLSTCFLYLAAISFTSGCCGAQVSQSPDVAFSAACIHSCL